MNRVIHFEIPADNPDRAASFYREVFGWSFEKWPGGPQEYWLVSTGDRALPGIDGGLLRRPNGSGAGTVNTVDVASVDSAIRLVEASGGKIVEPKMAVPGVGWLAYCSDPEGNVFGMMQADVAAK